VLPVVVTQGTSADLRIQATTVGDQAGTVIQLRVFDLPAGVLLNKGRPVRNGSAFEWLLSAAEDELAGLQVVAQHDADTGQHELAVEATALFDNLSRSTRKRVLLNIIRTNATTPMPAIGDEQGQGQAQEQQEEPNEQDGEAPIETLTEAEVNTVTLELAFTAASGIDDSLSTDIVWAVRTWVLANSDLAEDNIASVEVVWPTDSRLRHRRKLRTAIRVSITLVGMSKEGADAVAIALERSVGTELVVGGTSVAIVFVSASVVEEVASADGDANEADSKITAGAIVAIALVSVVVVFASVFLVVSNKKGAAQVTPRSLCPYFGEKGSAHKMPVSALSNASLSNGRSGSIRLPMEEASKRLETPGAPSDHPMIAMLPGGPTKVPKTAINGLTKLPTAVAVPLPPTVGAAIEPGPPMGPRESFARPLPEEFSMERKNIMGDRASERRTSLV
jgi:hypothetical protein